jgi:hypothetical protein
VWEQQPGILEALERLVSAHTKGDPRHPFLWTNKSLRNLEKGLIEEGFEVSYRVVGIMLRKLGYSLQADKKTLTVTPSHPDRNEQFEYINAEVSKAVEAGNPVVSIDGKKKERVGNFKNGGRTYQGKKTPNEVLDHDFPIPDTNLRSKQYDITCLFAPILRCQFLQCTKHCCEFPPRLMTKILRSIILFRSQVGMSLEKLRHTGFMTFSGTKGLLTWALARKPLRSQWNLSGGGGTPKAPLTIQTLWKSS